mmetsp:Transcript_17461/g.67759  ORF Transcript_17461/g.67759 Transcript_17461/m.67759 type:complete len:412 (+) Transcript_17461:79-1314(+)
MDTGTADSDLSYNSEDEDVFLDDSEELFDPVGDLLKKKVYSAYEGAELEDLKQRERDHGFRKEVIKQTPNRLERFRNWVWTTMTDPRSSALAFSIAMFIMFLIIVSVVLLVVQSWPTLWVPTPAEELGWFYTETFIVAVFTIEYVLRLLSYPKLNKFRFIINPMNIIDLLSVLPYYLDLIFIVIGISGDASFLAAIRLVRLVRVFRVFKLGRYSEYFGVVMLAMVASLDALFLLLFFLVLGMVLFSSLLYFAEQTQEEFDEDLEEWYYTDDSSDPGKLSPFQSIPHTLWWCIVTMTTVGYGDTFPITPLGKAVAGATMLLGLLLLAFPVGVLGAKFGQALEIENEKRATRAFVNKYTDHIAQSRLEILVRKLRKFEDAAENMKTAADDLLLKCHVMNKTAQHHLNDLAYTD